MTNRTKLIAGSLLLTFYAVGVVLALKVKPPRK